MAFLRFLVFGGNRLNERGEGVLEDLTWEMATDEVMVVDEVHEISLLALLLVEVNFLVLLQCLEGAQLSLTTKSYLLIYHYPRNHYDLKLFIPIHDYHYLFFLIIIRFHLYLNFLDTLCLLHLNLLQNCQCTQFLVKLPINLH